MAYSTSKKNLAKIKNGKAKAVAGVKVRRISGGSKNKITLKKLKKRTTYYVKVCAYRSTKGRRVYRKYSGVKKVKTKKK